MFSPQVSGEHVEVRTVNIYIDQICAKCGFKIPKGDKGYKVDGKVLCFVCFLMSRKKRSS
jgi:formylmethanofuran dehydrogenase subunit E